MIAGSEGFAVRKTWFVIAAAVLAACASQGHTVNEKMQAFVGQPVSILAGELGAPTRVDDSVGGNIPDYVWTSGGCTIRVILTDPEMYIANWQIQGNEHECAIYASMLK